MPDALPARSAPRVSLVLTAFLTLPLLAGCAHGPETPAAAAPAPPKTVGIVTPTVSDIARTMTQPATLQGSEEATLYARAAGTLRELTVDKGDRVRAGQVLAVIESPELNHQREQAGAGYREAEVAAVGAGAARSRAQAEVARAQAAVRRAQAEVREAEAVVARNRTDVARTEAQRPQWEAQATAAEEEVAQASEQQAQGEADVRRAEQQVRAAAATVQAAEAALHRTQAETRLHQLTYQRLKGIQDRDRGLIAAQEVDVARARWEAAQSDGEAARRRVEVGRQEVGAAEAQVESARRMVAAAGRKVEAARSRARAEREKLRVLEQDAESARAQVKVAEAKVEAARGQVGVAEAERRACVEQVRVVNAGWAAAREKTRGSRSALAAAAATESYTRVVAPFDGVVAERLADPGAFIQNASSNQASARGIVRLVRDRTLRVLIPVPERGMAYVRKGMAAAIQVDALPGQSFQGTVSRAAGAVDPRSRTMLTEVEISNPDGRLRPGMYARVTLTLETHRNALSIPTEAVMGKEADRSVYIVEAGHARKVPVQVGVDDGKMAEITEGLRPGVPVVVVGRDTLVDGAEVKSEPAPREPAKK